MLAVAMNRSIAVVAEVEAVKPFAVRFVVFEAQEWDRAHVDRLTFAGRCTDAARRIEVACLRDLKTEAVLVVFARDIAGERIASVGPPETRAVVRVKWQHLLGQTLSAIRLHCQIAVK